MTETTDPITHPLTALRKRRGWSLADLAAICSIGNDGKMARHRYKALRWERGVTPEMASQYAIAARVGLPRSTVDDHPWPEWLLLADPTDESTEDPWTGSHARAVLDSVVQSGAMDRRTFIGTTSAVLVSMTGSWLGATPADLAATGRGAVTMTAVEHLRRRVEELWRLDDALGGGGCFDAGVADLKLVNTLISTRRYDAEVGRELFQIAGALGRFCGWTAFDAGRLGSAKRFWVAGARCSAAAGDTDSGVYGQTNIALALSYAGDGAAALNILNLVRTRVPSHQRVMLSMIDTWSARAHAVTGDKAAAVAALHRADTLWDRRVPGDDPACVYWMPEPSTTAEAGTALLDAGDYRAAERNLLAGLHGREGASPRDIALYQARLAEVRARTGRLDEAVATAHEAIDLAAGIDSDRVRSRVNAVLELVPDTEPVHRELVEHRTEAWTPA